MRNRILDYCIRAYVGLSGYFYIPLCNKCFNVSIRVWPFLQSASKRGKQTACHATISIQLGFVLLLIKSAIIKTFLYVFMHGRAKVLEITRKDGMMDWLAQTRTDEQTLSYTTKDG